MMNEAIIDRVVAHLRTLPESLQLEALHLVQKLEVSVPIVTVPGKVLLQYIEPIDPDDIELMSQAIDADCERVDLDEW